MMYHIAESGKNSDGDLGRCQFRLRAGARAGADAVRFGHFSLRDSVHPDALSPSAERAWSLKLELPFRPEKLFNPDQYRTVLGWCTELGIDFTATPWDLPSLEMFRECGVRHFKVNSLNAHHAPLLARALQAAERTYLSTGGLSERQVRDLCARLALADHDVVLMSALCAAPVRSSVITTPPLEALRQPHPTLWYSRTAM